jgi:hypothetical protein
MYAFPLRTAHSKRGHPRWAPTPQVSIRTPRQRGSPQSGCSPLTMKEEGRLPAEASAMAMAPTVSPTNNRSRSRKFLGRAPGERRTPKTIDRYRRLLSLFARGPHSGLWGPKSERFRFGSKKAGTDTNRVVSGKVLRNEQVPAHDCERCRGWKGRRGRNPGSLTRDTPSHPLVRRMDDLLLAM